MIFGFIHGNHDSKTVAAFDSIWGTHWKSRNLHNRVVEIQGQRIAGLGGVFRGQIWMPPNKPMYFDPIHYCQYSPQEKIWRGELYHYVIARLFSLLISKPLKMNKPIF